MNLSEQIHFGQRSCLNGYKPNTCVIECNIGVGKHCQKDSGKR